VSRNRDFSSGIADHLPSLNPADFGYDDFETGSFVENPVRYKDDVFNVIDAPDRYRAGAHDTTEETLKPESLHSTQEWVDRGLVDQYADDPGQPIEVVRYNKNNYIMDGHHRAAAAMLSRKPISAKVYHWRDPS
jgi:hypothetical protein